MWDFLEGIVCLAIYVPIPLNVVQCGSSEGGKCGILAVKLLKWTQKTKDTQYQLHTLVDGSKVMCHRRKIYRSSFIEGFFIIKFNLNIDKIEKPLHSY